MLTKIDPGFWKNVEDRDKLKHVVYGDSIADYDEVFISFDGVNIKNIKFSTLWSILVNEYKLIPEIKLGKEYIIISNQLKILTYNVKKDTVELKTPIYLVRHYISKNICKLNFTNSQTLSVTYDHSLLKYGFEKGNLIPVSPSDTRTAIAVAEFNRANFISPINSKKNIVKAYILSKEEIEYTGYVYDFSVLENQNFVVNGFLVHNTDSLYVNVPQLEDKKSDPKVAWDIIEKLSIEINDIIGDLLDSTILPKLGVDSKHNRTSFKTEAVITNMILIGIKKNYAYKKIAEKGVIYDEPKVKYVGIPVVRSDYSKFAQDFIRNLVEDVALCDDKNKGSLTDYLNSLAKEKYDLLREKIEDLDLSYIATPGKWNANTYKSETFTVVGMRLYNTMVNKEVFRPNTSGLSLPIIIYDKNKFLEQISDIKSKSKLFLNNTNIDNINYIVIPYNFNKDILRKNLDIFKISIDFQETWEKNVTKITRNIIETIRG